MELMFLWYNICLTTHGYFFNIIFVWQHTMVGGVTFVEQEGNCAGKRQTPVEQKGWHTYMRVGAKKDR